MRLLLCRTSKQIQPCFVGNRRVTDTLCFLCFSTAVTCLSFHRRSRSRHEPFVKRAEQFRFYETPIIVATLLNSLFESPRWEPRSLSRWTREANVFSSGTVFDGAVDRSWIPLSRGLTEKLNLETGLARSVSARNGKYRVTHGKWSLQNPRLEWLGAIVLDFNWIGRRSRREREPEGRESRGRKHVFDH